MTDLQGRGREGEGEGRGGGGGDTQVEEMTDLQPRHLLGDRTVYLRLAALALGTIV